MQVDLNCDAGEGFGQYTFGQDEALFDLVTSTNIACGFHAGDPTVMRRTVELAIAKGVAIGAHPGLPDLVGFGRRPMAVSDSEVYDLMLYQLGALDSFVRAAGGRMRHVKPHGALYNMASAEIKLAEAVARATQAFDPDLILVGLFGSQLIRAGQEIGLRTAAEAFADRTYRSDGMLTSRLEPKSLIKDLQLAAEQALRIVLEKRFAAVDGNNIDVDAATICIHGDRPEAVQLARVVRQQLENAGVEIRQLS